MTIQTMFGQRWFRGLGLAGVAVVGYLFGATSDRLTAQPGTPPAPAPDRRIVAYIYGSHPVTREELGDFLIARGGYEKLDLLVNKKIIEFEANRRNVTVTATEVQAGLEDDLRGLGIPLTDFTKHVLPRYGKTLYEWTEDVIKPRLMLGKMCRDRVKVTEEDLKKVFENKYGEKRQPKIICWSKDDVRLAEKHWDEARKSDADFDRIARGQATASLAASTGLVSPIGRYPDVEDEKCTQILYTLKVGEMSGLFETPAGYMCIKCVAIVPPDSTVSFDKVRVTLEREVYDRKMSAEIPKFFTELKKVAQPNLLLKGPPSTREFTEGIMRDLQPILPAGGVPPGTTPPPMPRP